MSMYKLVLVDDECDVREGILQEIDWQMYGFEVIGIAENGKEAYDIVDKLVPDVVITDIKMPFMDGLVLSELIKQKYPATRIIILTGFDEFEFAQKAIKLHIDEYVLKPFSSQELINVLIKIKSQIDDETAQKKNIEKLREHYNKSLPILKANFLTLLITRKLNESEIFSKSNSFNINLNAKGFIVSVINLDKNTGDNFADKDLSLFAVLNIAEEIIEKYCLGIVFIHNGDIVILSVSQENESDTVINNTLTTLEEIRYCVEKYLKSTITIGVGAFCSDVSEINYSYKDAIMALDYKMILGNNRIIFINDLESRSTKITVFDELKEEALTSSIKVGTVAIVTRIIDTLFNELKEANVSYKEYQIYLMEILTSVLRIAKDSDIDLNNIMDANFNLFAEICRFDNIQEARNWTLGICTKIMDIISSNRQDNCRHLVKMAKDYTRDHFHDCDITINKICKYLHISPGYFSMIFKKEEKITYLNYLVHMRMEAAKELLRTTELKSFEIAERVGFSDANYFSNSFKKNFGISPSEYRINK
jgi:two-component system, response regulator YesN